VLWSNAPQTKEEAAVATLLDAGAIWIEDDFIPYSLALFKTLAVSVTWDDRMRARQAASFGLPYNYSGVVWPEAPFPEPVAEILERVAVRLGYRPNNCLAHLYPGGDSSMGFHADATDDLEADTGIAVVSLGAERVLTFRSQGDRSRQENYPLKTGSLLFMCAEMQRDWKHAILPATDIRGGRISLTFRRMKRPACP
jgi:alkylated DNA repair dioxygenase AlkB